jgi:hypothetical protein
VREHKRREEEGRGREQVMKRREEKLVTGEFAGGHGGSLWQRYVTLQEMGLASFWENLIRRKRRQELMTKLLLLSVAIKLSSTSQMSTNIIIKTRALRRHLWHPYRCPPPLQVLLAGVVVRRVDKKGKISKVINFSVGFPISLKDLKV